MQLSIFDASSLVYSGVMGGGREIKAEGLPVNGVVHALRYIIPQGITKGHTLVCFDSFTNRSSIISSYKKGRRKYARSEVASQLELLKEILDMAGVATLKVEGYEADDLIFSAHRKLKHVYRSCHIYSSDKDLAINVDDVTLLHAVNSNGVDINVRNYKNAFGSEEIMLGTSPIHKVFFGDNSDNIPPFSSSRGFSTSTLYAEACKPLKQLMAQNPFAGHERLYMDKLMESWYNGKIFDEKEYKDICDRIEVIYPRMYDNEIPYSSYVSEPLTKFGYSLAEFCYIFREFNLCRLLGTNLSQAKQEHYDLLRRYAKTFNSGAYAFSRNFNPNESTRDYSGVGLRVFDEYD